MADMSDDDNVIMYELQNADGITNVGYQYSSRHHASCMSDMRDDDGIMVNGYSDDDECIM